MSLELQTPKIDLPEPEIQARFDRLQAKLVSLWQLIESLEDHGEQTIVVVPSLTVDFDALQGSLLQAYEERFLFLLFLLRQPRARLIYVTSQPIQPSIVDYYLSLLPGIIPSHARERLVLLAPQDGAPQPLSIKLLQRPRLLAKLRSLIGNPERAHLVPFNTTDHERDLALRLGIPMYGADPRFLDLGTKSGCRELFKSCDVQHPVGIENLTDTESLIDAVIELRKTRPEIAEAMVKHNDGVSGEGNAVLDLGSLPPQRDAVRERLRSLKLEAKHWSVDQYLEKLARYGGVIEQRVIGSPLTSPSVQLRVTPLGKVELLSTHDQLLGGAQGQKYIGCTFPADPAYAREISTEALKVGEALARRGVLGRFAIDFVCGKTDQGWSSYAIELNLRKGGTTHPFLTLQFLTDGSYDAERSEFRIGDRPKCYVATDSLESPSFRQFTPGDLFDICVRHGLHYDHTRQTGVVLHMLSAIGDHGRLGLTAIADSHAEARALYERMERAMHQEAELASHYGSLPE
ncbi:MAG: peptide ligase PGM1-related protein [Polyangiaceae bacterium]